jgi:hypothetical protein
MEVEIQQGRTRSGKFRCHLADDILTRGSVRWDGAIDISRDTEENVLDPVLDVVNAQRDCRHGSPVSPCHLNRMLIVILLHLSQLALGSGDSRRKLRKDW